MAAAACLLFVLAIPFIRDQIGYAALGAALIVVVAFAVLDRAQLRLSLVPWQLLIFVSGLFLVVPTLSRYGLADVMTALIGTDSNGVGVYRAAAAGAGLSNVLNNLPAYVAGEAVVPAANHDQLLGLLIGVKNIVLRGPAGRNFKVLKDTTLPLGRFTLTGLGLATVALAGSVAALLLGQ